MKYPEHEKLKSLQGENQVVGNFLEWLRRNYDICVYNNEFEEYMIAYMSTEDFLAEYYQIDRAKLENEKREMLEELKAGRV